MATLNAKEVLGSLCGLGSNCLWSPNRLVAVPNTTTIVLRVDRACQMLDISRARFYELVRSGELKTVRLGPRGVRVHADDLDRFIRGLPTGTE